MMLENALTTGTSAVTGIGHILVFPPPLSVDPTMATTVEVRTAMVFGQLEDNCLADCFTPLTGDLDGLPSSTLSFLGHNDGLSQDFFS